MAANYIEELNESQREAVLYNEGPSLVIAGAGSGKTRVLTCKIAYLIEQGLAPWDILALTFTNKAAKEMKERIAAIVGWQTASRLWMGTFHSIFSRILRTECNYIGYDARFTVYDQSDSRSLIKAIIKEMALDEKVYKPALIGNRISNAKNRLMTASNYEKDSQLLKYDAMNNIAMTGKIYARYVERCRKANAMDFDDLLLYTYLLFTAHPEVCQRYADRFQFVLVDEYQDTNYAQHAIIWLLTKAKKRICVVGDDAQSIYGFRGADINNILRFTEQYEGAKLFKLEQNYRSTQAIVEAANHVIAHNTEQIQKSVYSENEKGDPIHIYRAYSDLEEADIICNKISELHSNKDLAYSDFAILYRTNAQSRVFEETLRKRLMPYRIYGGLSFYQRKEIKDVIAYFRLAVNPHDEEALKRVINYPARGIGDTTMKKIMAEAASTGSSLWEVLVKTDHLGIQKGTQAKLVRFREMIEGFMKAAEHENAFELGQNIIRVSGIMNEIRQDNSPENLSRQDNIMELTNALHVYVEGRYEEEGDVFVSMGDYLSQVSLLSDMDTDDTDEEKITLMTIHSAKGLEFPVVFVVGVEDGTFPNECAHTSRREMEEERRLFYVAITRAKSYCFLSCSQSRFRYGKMEFCSPSPFLNEIGHKKEARNVQRIAETYKSNDLPLTRITGLKIRSSIISSKEPTSSSADSVMKQVGTEALHIGNLIEHERFGVGEVLALEGTGDNCKATVQFQHSGRKQLLLKFARFKVLK